MAIFVGVIGPFKDDGFRWRGGNALFFGRSDPYFDAAPVLNLSGSFKTINYRLWDEDNGKMIGFRQLKRQLALKELDQAA